MKQGLEPVFNEFGFRFQHLAQLSEVLPFERLNSRRAGDQETTGHRQERSEREFPSDRQRHPDPSGSLSLYPSDFTDTMASSRSGSFCLSRRICTSTVLVVP